MPGWGWGGKKGPEEGKTTAGETQLRAACPGTREDEEAEPQGLSGSCKGGTEEAQAGGPTGGRGSPDAPQSSPPRPGAILPLLAGGGRRQRDLGLCHYLPAAAERGARSAWPRELPPAEARLPPQARRLPGLRGHRRRGQLLPGAHRQGARGRLRPPPQPRGASG